FNVFEEGQGLASARLVTQGAFPWRDFFAAHGLLEDTFRPLIGSTVLDPSRWGSIAGSTLLLSPLYLVSMYLLFVYLFRRRWPLLIVSGLVLIGPFGPQNWRLILWPIVLLLLAALLAKPSLPRSVGFTGLLLAQAII